MTKTEQTLLNEIQNKGFAYAVPGQEGQRQRCRATWKLVEKGLVKVERTATSLRLIAA